MSFRASSGNSKKKKESSKSWRVGLLSALREGPVKKKQLFLSQAQLESIPARLKLTRSKYTLKK
mgnify:CR=1 FL=1